MNVYPALPPGASPTLDTPEVFTEVVLVIHDTAIFSLHGKAPARSASFWSAGSIPWSAATRSWATSRKPIR